MAERIFAAILLAVTLGYLWIAFSVIRAPIQYDPLGPESWPRLIGLAAVPCWLYILARPDTPSMGTSIRTLARLGLLIGLLFGYAWLYVPLGFILSTFLFCVALSLMLGARPRAALAFGAATGVVGYYVCTGLLELNLPAGILDTLM